MIKPGIVRIRQPRHQSMILTIGAPLLDLSGASMTFEVRENKDAPAAILAVAVSDDADGITRNLIAVGGQPYTTIEIRLTKPTLEAVPLAVPIGSDLNLFYCYKIGGFEYMKGEFILEAQANHA